MEWVGSDMEGEHVEMQKLVSSPGNDGEEAKGSNQPQLRRELNVFHLVGLVVGGIIGSGIFISPREVVKDVQSYGMALVIWVLAGLIAMAGALCYSELGTLIKKANGEAAYIKQAYSFNSKNPNHIMLGELLSFLFVWTMSVFVRPAGAAIVLLTFGEYITKAAQPYCDLSNNSIRVLALAALGECIHVYVYCVKVLRHSDFPVQVFCKTSKCRFVKCSVKLQVHTRYMRSCIRNTSAYYLFRSNSIGELLQCKVECYTDYRFWFCQVASSSSDYNSWTISF